MSLLEHELVEIKRRVKGTSFVNDDGDFVEAELQETSLKVRGNIQPSGDGKIQKELPEGIYSRDVLIFRTKEKLVASDDIKDTYPDQLVDDGILYECFNLANWSRYGLQSDHYKYVFIRKDKLGGDQ